LSAPSLQELLDRAIASRLREVWTSLPARVVSAQVAGGPVDLQLLPGDFQNGEAVELPILGSVPVGYPAASGGGIRYSLSIGDLVLVVFSCRPTGGLEQGGASTEIQDTRTHSLSDPFCLPLAVFGAPAANYLAIARDGDDAMCQGALTPMVGNWYGFFSAVASFTGLVANLPLPAVPIGIVSASSTVEAT
tara:strand:- start:2446 stop:3018 length:573 start_codon:yes stop_codon:yes gene_type:complete